MDSIKKNHTKKFAIEILILVILVILITGGISVWQYFKTPQKDVCSKRGLTINCLSDTLCQNANCQKLNEHCFKIINSKNKGMDIFFVGSNYPLNNILYNNRYNLNDFNVNLENDTMRLLYSTDYNFGYGLLTIEPFASNLDKINVYLITESFQYDWTQGGYYFQAGKELVKKYCNAVYTSDDVITVINADNNPLTYGIGGGSDPVAALHRKGQHNYKDVGTVFIHELGHAFGLQDYYGFGYQLNGLMSDSTAIPNCDNTAGCPKWCKYPPKPPFKTTCDNYITKALCEQYQDCLWLEKKDPYFGTQCIRNDGYGYYKDGEMEILNIGAGCLEGTGCYFGCFGSGWRPWEMNNFADRFSQRIDAIGKKHTFDPVSEKFLEEIFECCYSRNCKNYNFAKCSDFAKKYSKYSSCTTCSK